MPRAKAEAGARLDRSLVGQHAVLEPVDLERAWILGFLPPTVVAARDQDERLVRWRRQDLVSVDPKVEVVGLPDLLADHPVGLDPVHADAARGVVGDEQEFAATVHAVMDRARAQLSGSSCGVSVAGRGIDTKDAGMMLVAFLSGAAGARRDIEEAARRVRPRILRSARQHHGGCACVSAAPSTSMS